MERKSARRTVVDTETVSNADRRQAATRRSGA